MPDVNIMWFRRDLRLHDNAALYHALSARSPVIPIFIFDELILSQLEDKADKRVAFIHAALHEMQKKLLAIGSSMEVFVGKPLDIFRQLVSTRSIRQVFTNHDYEPYAIQRDDAVKTFLAGKGIDFSSFKDQVIFEKDEVLKDDLQPYTVFTPYSRKWTARLTDFYLRSYPTEKYFEFFHMQPCVEIPALAKIGFQEVELQIPSSSLSEELLKKYAEQRNFPGINGTSRMGVHLRFGTVSIRELVRKSRIFSETYLKELVWREFYQMILWKFPRVGNYQSFKPEYDLLEWRNDEHEFQRWCNGETGYPIVDAGMRELNTTGFMHNRVRMIVASFLAKHLLIDWRLGEAYFAQKLMDYDLASNNGGWQWAAGSGCDSAPYFRIFNPTLQALKFDPRFEYINKWVPEFQEFTYPKPIVVHEEARKRCLEVYGKALRK